MGLRHFGSESEQIAFPASSSGAANRSKPAGPEGMASPIRLTLGSVPPRNLSIKIYARESLSGLETSDYGELHQRYERINAKITCHNGLVKRGSEKYVR
jgi:hypothetical protein